jgi:uncharacterized protein (TIGR02466 family)
LYLKAAASAAAFFLNDHRRNDLAMAQIFPIFATPIFIHEFADRQTMNAALKPVIFDAEKQNKRNTNPYTFRNPEVFESEFNFFDWDYPAIKQLRELCFSALMQVVRELNAYSEKDMAQIRIFAESWFHITRRNGFFGTHNHPNASWSGVYCVDPGTANPEQPESGDLVFVHPTMGANMYLDSGNAFLKTPFAFNNQAFKQKAGQLILFPSHLVHHVMPYFGDGERITIAFNCKLIKQP